MELLCCPPSAGSHGAVPEPPPPPPPEVATEAVFAASEPPPEEVKEPADPPPPAATEPSPPPAADPTPAPTELVPAAEAAPDVGPNTSVVVQLENDVDALEVAIASSIAYEGTSTAQHVRMMIVHAFSFAAGLSWTVFLKALIADSFSESPELETPTESWLCLGAANIIGMPLTIAIARHSAALSGRADTALAVGNADAAAALRFRTSGVDSLATNMIAHVYASLMDNALANSLPDGNAHFARALIVSLLTVLVGLVTSVFGTTCFSKNGKVVHNVIEVRSHQIRAIAADSPPPTCTHIPHLARVSRRIPVDRFGPWPPSEL